jgi:23S rRNA (uracil1939-C5)-methyltransferase
MIKFATMELKEKKQQVIENLLVIDISAEGKGVAKWENRVVFITKAVPGDVVDAKIIKKKKNLLEAEILQIKVPSQNRIEAVCEHFGSCGGCKWQNMTYANQIQFKQNQAKEQLERIGKLTINEPIKIKSASKIYNYRNKLEFSFSNKKWLIDLDKENQENINLNALGFHVSQRFDKVLHINNCHLMDELGNKIRNFVYEKSLELNLSFYDAKAQTGFLRNLLIRNTSTNQWMVVLIVNQGFEEKLNILLQQLTTEFPQINSLQYIINTKRNDSFSELDANLFMGNAYIEEKLENYVFRISPQSFFQTNTYQGLELYRTVRDFAKLKGDEIVYDLYSGTGSISIFMSGLCRKVIGVEYVEQAVKDARINSMINNVKNCEFFSGDMKDLISEEFFAVNGKPDVIITDPPRAGMHLKVVEQLKKSKVPVIIYVSCNVSTQARDLELLSEFYQPEDILAVDMFPHTSHLENVVRLKLKS